MILLMYSALQCVQIDGIALKAALVAGAWYQKS